jgi:hypothetical protein
LKGKVVLHDPNWSKPMTEEGVDAFLEGRLADPQVRVLAYNTEHALALFDVPQGDLVEPDRRIR